MKTQLLVASQDHDYTDHLSLFLAEYHSDVIDVSVCSTVTNLHEQLNTRKFDIALLEAALIDGSDLASIHLPILLWSQADNINHISDGSTMSKSTGDDKYDLATQDNAKLPHGNIKRIKKYQRISIMVSSILELYAKSKASQCGMETKIANITAVWSPAGGVGKTSVALALSARKAAEGKQVLYLNLEQFSSMKAYFAETGKSISSALEMLEHGEGDLKLLLRSIRQQDRESALSFFSKPENFDDMNILTTENIADLIEACSVTTDELIIDMSCACDERNRKVFELADRVLLVTDASHTAQIKFGQFASQHNVFQNIRSKTALVANKGAVISDALVDAVINLPSVQSSDSSMIYRTLSTYELCR